MDVKEALRIGIMSGEFVCSGYLADLTDQEMMHRPHPECNHINWQVGHLIVEEHEMVETIKPGTMPPLPEGFAKRYTKETTSIDDPSAFCTKEQLLQAMKDQRAGTLAVLDQISEDELDLPTPLSYAPTVASIFAMQGAHWLMHSGQWVIVRRQLGRPPLF